MFVLEGTIHEVHRAPQLVVVLAPLVVHVHAPRARHVVHVEAMDMGFEFWWAERGGGGEMERGLCGVW
jgi:hypothetical protein